MIGLDIGRVTIKAAQVTQTPKGPRLDGVLCMRRMSHGGALSEDEADKLMRALRRRGLDSMSVVLLAASDAIISGSISIPPPQTPAPRETIVQMELCRAYRLTPQTFEFAWWDLPPTTSGGQTNQAHVVALPHAAVAPIVNTLDAKGFEVVKTLPASIALLTAALRRPIDPRRIVAVIDLGAQASRLALIYAGRVVHERLLPEFNAKVIEEGLAQELDTTVELARQALTHFGLRDEPDGAVACGTTMVLNSAVGALAEQIGMSFAFISHLYPDAELGPLLLTGGAANMPGLTNALSQELDLETQTLTPGTLVKNECFGSETNDPAVTAALGAALFARADA